MRIEFIVMLITFFIIGNIYSDGLYLKSILSYQKYYQMFGVAFVGFMVCQVFKHNPNDTKNILMTTNEYLKYLPLDKHSTDIINPIMNFTSQSNIFSSSRTLNDVQDSTKKVKRSVSETKKKFVASKQKWLCASCDSVLNAWFEVDHIKRLEHGGTNDIDNLRALCRECHGKKTTIENL